MTNFPRVARDFVHGLSEEARTLLALGVMVVVAVGFVSVWISGLSGRLVAIAPLSVAAPDAGAGNPLARSAPPSPFAGLAHGAAPASAGAGPAQSAAQDGGLIAPEQEYQEPPTPLRGIAQTLSGFERIFAAQERPALNLGSLAGAAGDAWRAAGDMLSDAADFIYLKVSPILGY